MPRRVKRRTHVGAKGQPAGGTVGQVPAEKSIDKMPKSMVIRTGAGDVGPSVSQLAKDVRKVMEPGTASRLQERKGNKLRDYTTMSGPLGVTHLILFSRSPSGNTHMRVAITPNGPTLHFRIDNYSLCKDIMRAMRHPRNDKNAYLNPPLLVLNNFISQQLAQSKDNSSKSPIAKQLEQLCTTVFQSLFPPLKPQETPLSSIKRVLLLNREPTPAKKPSTSTPKQADDDEEEDDDDDEGAASFVLTFRHYAITTRPVGLSRAVKRLRTAEKHPAHFNAAASKPSKKQKRGRALPNLGNLTDISEWLLNSNDPSANGYTSASESELDTDAEVEVSVTEKKSVGKRSRGRASASQPDGPDGTEPSTNGDENEDEEMEDDDSEDDGVSTAATGSESARSRVEKRAVKLVEIGPRMRLRLIKIEEGICQGRVMWHEFIHKSVVEQREQEKEWAQKTKLREDRRKVQKANVERKKQQKLAQREQQQSQNRARKDDQDEDDGEYSEYSDVDALEDEDLDELEKQAAELSDDED